MKKSLLSFVGTMLLAAPALFGEVSAEKVRKELVTLPFYSIYDNVMFRVDGSTVTLMGSVIRPTMKTSAERVVRKIEGVDQVVNEIEVLPLSPFDDGIRIRVARALYGNNVLNRYAIGANPPIRVVVKNGEVTLEGIVNNEMERNVAFITANGVSGVFKVTNNLRVERRRSES